MHLPSGASLTTGDIVLASLSATQGININLGGMSGTTQQQRLTLMEPLFLMLGAPVICKLTLDTYRRAGRLH